MTTDETTAHCKDAILNDLAQHGNVAQFVSFGPDLQQRFLWIRGHQPNVKADSLEAVQALLTNAPEGKVNIRSFSPQDPKSKPFIYGLDNVADVLTQVTALAAQGLYTIVAETVDIHDGGVSGVLFGNVVEFTPGDTPRGVEKPGVLSLPVDLARRLLRTVYGFEPDLSWPLDTRVEFSLHPMPRGYRGKYTIVWEREEFESAPGNSPVPSWPNNFSRLLGDKVFGLLMAHMHDAAVPFTTVIPRGLAPFSFGEPTPYVGWLRTAPAAQTPGKFTTVRGWMDPFALMQREDPEGTLIASVLHQHGVYAAYSGAAFLEEAGGEVRVEGVSGLGDGFMVGERAPEELPQKVLHVVEQEVRYLSGRFQDSPLRIEWVYDGTKVWVVQCHVGATGSSGNTIVPGEPSHGWFVFNVERGLEELRGLISEVQVARSVQGEEFGITLVGNVGITSHFGDVLRKAKVPSRLQPPEE